MFNKCHLLFYDKLNHKSHDKATYHFGSQIFHLRIKGKPTLNGRTRDIIQIQS